MSENEMIQITLENNSSIDLLFTLEVGGHQPDKWVLKPGQILKPRVFVKDLPAKVTISRVDSDESLNVHEVNLIDSHIKSGSIS